VPTNDLFFARWSSRLLSVLRIIAAFMLIQHGAQKLFSFPAPPPQQAAQQNAQQQPAPQRPSGLPPNSCCKLACVMGVTRTSASAGAAGAEVTPGVADGWDEAAGDVF
jgi:uncharacterized membrane protein YphA (DoxX/SURF4 family)